MDLSIIIPTKDRAEILNGTLRQALAATQHIAVEIIVVNDSKTSSPDISGFRDKPIRMIQNAKSGVASARNLGASMALADLILFLDDDILISKESINQTLAEHRAEDEICVNPDWIYPEFLQSRLVENSFGRFLIAYNFVSCKGWYNHPRWQDQAMFETPGLASFHLSILKKCFQKSGGYDETFPYAGFEDHAFSHALQRAGIKLLINTKVIVFHNEEDRIELKNWLQRQVRGSETRKIGVRIGYSELSIHYSFFKRMILPVLLLIKPLIVWVADTVPNYKWLDIIYFRIVLTLQAVSIYEGYSKK